MADEIKPTLPTEQVKPETPEVDWEAKYKESQDALIQVAAERENYKTVALSKKGKGEEETDEERMRRIAREVALETQESELKRKTEEIAQKAFQENKELKVALKNRGQVGASPATGGAQSPTDVKVDYFSEEQKTALKKTYDRLPLKGKSFDEFLDTVKQNDLKLKNK